MRTLRIYAIATLPALVILGIFTYFANWIPQTRWEPPSKREITAAMTPAQLAQIGGTIVQERGCLACHTLEPGVGVQGGGRGPNLFDLASRRAQGVVGGPSKLVDYLVQALYDPGAYLVEGYANIMPPAIVPPARLSYEEVTAVVAYLQSLGGSPSVRVGDLPRPSGAAAPGPAPQPPASDAAAIMAKYGCLACHKVKGQGGAIGPSLDEAARQAGKRVPGLSAEAYLRQSILEPNAFVVAGFPGNVMPLDLSQRMAPGEVDTLVKYLLSLAAKP